MNALHGGGMRALPGPPSSGSGSGGGSYGGGYSGGSEGGEGFAVQPGLWILPVIGLVVLNGGAWLLDQLTAAWCHVEGEGCVSTHYLADLLHIYEIIVGCVAALVVAALGYRYRWHIAITWAVLWSLAWAVRRIRQEQARRTARARARGTTVRVEVVEPEPEDVVEVVDVIPSLTAERSDPVDVGVLVGDTRTMVDRQRRSSSRSGGG